VNEAEAVGAGHSSVWVILLAGGRGTRFWPVSRAAHPKQLLRLFGDKTLLRATWERFAATLPKERILVVTGPAYADATRRELPELPLENVILEPSGRDTAPAIALAMREVRGRDPGAVCIVAPTDHFIGDEKAFREALETGVTAAASGSLVTFGVKPDRPATVYGYIETKADPGAAVAVPVVRFHEKPGPDDARRYLATGRFLWNAGIFAWSIGRFDASLGAAAPALAAAVSALPACAPPGSPGYEVFAEAWKQVPSISIDYALMERTTGIQVVPLAAGWSDLGGWDAIRDLLPADTDNNRAAPDVAYVRSHGCSVHRAASAPADARRLYALVGVEDLVVVETDDAVLICKEGSGEALRELVSRLRSQGREDLL
jgi:mannose-1-phosphate guanylyltransferase/mannose-6-phosphate isomerase